MIFVTVGTCCFDALIEEVDRLRGIGCLQGSVVCQIGDGLYLPQHCEYFRFAPSLKPWYEQADMVICHGGTGSVSELLRLKKPFVAVANMALSGNHQADFLAACEEAFGICWCRKVADLSSAIELAENVKPQVVSGEHLTHDLRRYLQRLHARRSREPL